MMQMQSANMWEELSDQQIDDRDVEADYFIDRAPDAIFIPNEEGTTKATQIFDGDKIIRWHWRLERLHRVR